MKTIVCYHGKSNPLSLTGNNRKYDDIRKYGNLTIENQEWGRGILSNFISEYKGNLCDLIILLAAPVEEDERISCAELIPEIGEIVIGYPEITFFFERIAKKNETEASCMISGASLINDLGLDPKDFSIEMIKFSIVDNPAEHLNKLITYSNLFDASNIRCLFKMFKFKSLEMQSNYLAFMSTRAGNLATVIDEEYIMANRIAYSLFACGYRSLSISSDILFNDVKDIISNEAGIILRDFDLQMHDAPAGESGYEFIDGNNKYVINNIDFIRGFKLFDKYPNPAKEDSIKEWINLTNKPILYDKTSKNGKPVINKYWDGFSYGDNNHIYCVAHGYEQMIIDTDGKKPSWTISNSNRELHAPGFQKPIVGIYHSISTAIRETVPVVENLRKDKSGMKYSRENHDHSVSLDLYKIVVPMLTRAELYYGEGEFILAAILSQECIELLNGMHATLGNKAILIHAKAENAIAMNDIGGNEKLLAMDCERRIEFIKDDVMRLNERFAYSNVMDDTTNILNQIFSDCRQYCHEKEHFLSEEVFIDAMAKLNEGAPLSRLWGTIFRK